MTDVRKGQAPDKMTRAAFAAHFRKSFYDPRFAPEREALDRLEEIAWQNYSDARKSPVTEKAGPGFADPDYDLSVEWRATRDAIAAAGARQKDKASPSRVLLVCASDRNDGSCPGEMSKSFRLSKEVQIVLEANGIAVDLLDLSLLISDPGRKIYPCKACVSTSMALCHWPCSCYPNHSLMQTGDWMAEIYERFAAAHGVIIVTPVYWGQVPGALKAMMDRLVCADGGNADPSSTHGKKAEEAKALELKGWDYPRHLTGRVFGIVAHGDTADVESVSGALAGWLEWMDLIPAGNKSLVDRYIGYWQPYATSHDALDKDDGIVGETRNVAYAVARAVAALRDGTLTVPDKGLKAPRQK
jgi:multimeric flavodoxin WrbA